MSGRAVVEVVAQPLVTDEKLDELRDAAVRKSRLMISDNLPHIVESVMKEAIAGSAAHARLILDREMPAVKQVDIRSVHAEFSSDDIKLAMDAVEKHR